MLARFLPWALAVLVLHVALPVGLVPARAQDVSAADRARVAVERLGTGKRVRVRLTNGTRVEGHLGDIGPEGFVVVRNRKTGETTRVAYADVAEVRKKMSSGKKFLLGLAIVGVVVGLVLLVIYADECGLARSTSEDPCPPECKDCQ
jgi:hypothetical protein